MPQPAWSNPPTVVSVPAKADALWTMAVEHIEPSKKLRITVATQPGAQGAQEAQKWKLSNTQEVTADGMPVRTPVSPPGLLLSVAPAGALIAKIGGSSADLPPAADATAPRLFAVGSFCVVALTGSESGPLFLTMNDAPSRFDLHSGSLTVTIEEGV